MRNIDLPFILKTIFIWAILNTLLNVIGILFSYFTFYIDYPDFFRLGSALYPISFQIAEFTILFIVSYLIFRRKFSIYGLLVFKFIVLNSIFFTHLIMQDGQLIYFGDDPSTYSRYIFTSNNSLTGILFWAKELTALNDGGFFISPAPFQFYLYEFLSPLIILWLVSFLTIKATHLNIFNTFAFSKSKETTNPTHHK